MRIRRRMRFVFFISSSSDSRSTWAPSFSRPPETISCSTKDSKTLYARALFSQYFLGTRPEDDLRNNDCRLDSLTEDDEEDGDREQILRHDELWQH